MEMIMENDQNLEFCNIIKHINIFFKLEKSFKYK